MPGRPRARARSGSPARSHRKERADEPEAEGECPAVHELARDPGLLRARRRVDLANELHELALRPVRAVHEAEDADEKREQRDEREEDLVGDRAGEERAVVVPEGLGDAPAPPAYRG